MEWSLLGFGLMVAVLQTCTALDYLNCNFDQNNLCQLQQVNSIEDVMDWTLLKGDTPTVETGPSADHTTGQGYYVYLEASDPAVINDNARLFTPTMESGRYMVDFWYSVVGQYIGTLNVFARQSKSRYNQIIWYYTPKFNSSSASWMYASVSINQETDFQLIFEAVRGSGPQGDIALDDILIYRTGDPVTPPISNAFGLPINCDFDQGNICNLVSPYYTSSIDWTLNQGDTPSLETGPSVDHTLGTANGWYIYSEASNANPGWRSIIATPRFLPVCGCYYLDFWYHAYGSAVTRLSVYEEGYDAPLWYKNVTSLNSWRHMRQTYYTERKTSTRLLFVGEIGFSHTSDYALDDINVEDCGCPESSTTPITTSTTTTTPTTTSPTTTRSTTTIVTTPHPKGHDYCNFDLGPCAYLFSSSGFRWSLVGGYNPSRVPSGDATTGTGQFAFADSRTPGSNNVAYLTMDRFIENPNSCHSVSFIYSLAGSNPGRLSALLQNEDGEYIRELWGITQATNGWRQVDLVFRLWEKFKVVFQAKRNSPPGESDFALDDITIPETSCVDVPLYPPSDNSQATGNVYGNLTRITGTAGVIQSPNYKNPYPNSFFHTWIITVTNSSTIELYVQELNTEDNRDLLLARETTGAPIFTKSGSVVGQALYQSRTNSVTVTFQSDDSLSLPGWVLAWREIKLTTTTPTTTSTMTTTATTTVTTSAPTVATTPHAQGQETCTLDVSLCSFAINNLTTGFRWTWVGGYNASRVPVRDATSGTGNFLFADSRLPGANNIAQVTMNRFVENPSSCHSLLFKYNLAGNNPGRLTVYLQTEAGVNVRELWSTSQPTAGWTDASVVFRYWQRFEIMFEAKRLSTTGGSDFALDDISIPVTPCDRVPLYPPSNTSQAIGSLNGNTTRINGTAGVILSPNYKQSYPSLFEHTWIVTVTSPSVIELELLDLTTEDNRDILAARETTTAAVIFSRSGQLVGQTKYRSSTNSVTISFTSDATINLEGWRLSWREISLLTTTTTTTIPPAYGYFSCSFNQFPDLLCGIQIDTLTSFYQWFYHSGVGPNFPLTGPPSGGGYLIVNSSQANTIDRVATLRSRYVFNNDGCHRLTFSYLARGPNLGTFIISYSPVNITTQTTLWSFDGVSSGDWKTETLTISQAEPIMVVFSTKRVQLNGNFSGGDFAIDYINLSPCQFTSTTSAPPVNNGVAFQRGKSGEIRSANYPLPYPSYNYTWQIDSSSNARSRRAVGMKRISLSILDFQTEQCCDKVMIFDPDVNETVAELSGNIRPQTFYSSGTRLSVTFITDNQIFLKGFYMSWFEQDVITTQSTSPPSTTPHAQGQLFCDFEGGFCNLEQPNSGLKWALVSGYKASRIPPGDATTGVGSFSFVDSSAQVEGDTAFLTTPGFIENPSSCQYVTFMYSISGNNPGTLRVWLQSAGGDNIRELWSSSASTNGWTGVDLGFRFYGRYKIMFEAKRKNSLGGSDFSLDNVDFPIRDCSQAPLAPVSPENRAIGTPNGNQTIITGRNGLIVSPNYPSPYPSKFSHQWIISLSANATIKLTILSIETEMSRDIIQAKEAVSEEAIFSLSGFLIQNRVYYSKSNSVSIDFTSDESTEYDGWRIIWQEVFPETVTTPATTIPPAYGLFSCQFDDSSLCGLSRESDDEYYWYYQTGRSINYPSSGPLNDKNGNSANGYVLIDSRAQVDGDVAYLITNKVYSYQGCFQLQFSYHANGTNIGSLSVAVRQNDSVRELWVSDGNSNSNWRTSDFRFNQDGPFQLVWAGKRVLSKGVYGDGDIALDDIRLSLCDFSGPATTAAPTLANGAVTFMTGQSGEIKSLNYPNHYNFSSEYRHTWAIEGSVKNKVVGLIIKDFSTEACCDKVYVYDDVTNTSLGTFSGNVPVNTIVFSSSNRMRILFSADAKVFMSGFLMAWFLTSPPQPTESPVTTVVTLPATGAQINEATSGIEIGLAVAGCVLLVALVIVIIVFVCIRKKNAQAAKVSGSEENMNLKLIEKEDQVPKPPAENTYDTIKPQNELYYMNSMYPQYYVPTYPMFNGTYNPNNVVTKPLTKKAKKGKERIYLNQNGQPSSDKRYKPRRSRSRDIDGAISIPNGNGQNNPYTTPVVKNSSQKDNPPSLQDLY